MQMNGTASIDSRKSTAAATAHIKVLEKKYGANIKVSYMTQHRPPTKFFSRDLITQGCCLGEREHKFPQHSTIRCDLVLKNDLNFVIRGCYPT